MTPIWNETALGSSSFQASSVWWCIEAASYISLFLLFLPFTAVVPWSTIWFCLSIAVLFLYRQKYCLKAQFTLCMLWPAHFYPWDAFYIVRWKRTSWSTRKTNASITKSLSACETSNFGHVCIKMKYCVWTSQNTSWLIEVWV